MKIYRIDFNECDYDQFNTFIVRAENEEAVERVVRKKYPDEQYTYVNWKAGFKIVEITPEGEEGIILGSFNAG